MHSYLFSDAFPWQVNGRSHDLWLFCLLQTNDGGRGVSGRVGIGCISPYLNVVASMILTPLTTSASTTVDICKNDAGAPTCLLVESRLGALTTKGDKRKIESVVDLHGGGVLQATMERNKHLPPSSQWDTLSVINAEHERFHLREGSSSRHADGKGGRGKFHCVLVSIEAHDNTLEWSTKEMTPQA